MGEKLHGLIRTHHCGELGEENVEEEVILCGWVNKYRDLGSLHFIDIRDKYGVTQLGFEEFQGDIEVLKNASLESVIYAKGIVRLRPDAAINKNMKTGMVEIQVKEFDVLSQSDNIPFLPYGHVEASEDLKLKYRYLDLRTKRLQEILALRSRTSLKVRQALHNEGFVEVETPVLYKSTPEGARDYIVPSRVHSKHVYALPQSPQTLKQLLMIGGTDKYFQICKCFRDEDLRADRQPEFTQIDIEVSYATPKYIKGLAQKLVKQIFDVEDDFELPVMSYSEAMRLYGSDKPDIRFGLEHLIVTDLFKESSFGTFSQIQASKGLIKAIFVPLTLGQFSRKDVDSFTNIVKPHGGKGVAWFKVNEGERTGGISKFITDEIYDSLSCEESNKGNGTWLFFADSDEEVAHACADALRKHLGHKLELISDENRFLLVNDFPLLEWSEKENRFVAKHHPFTMPKDECLDGFMSGDHEKLKNCLADAYDVVCNGYELGGGSMRIYKPEIQDQMFSVLGMSKEDSEKQFGFFLEALRYGVPPHGGIAFGLDRVLMILAKTDNIKDVIAFPKTTSASDLMSSAPSMPAQHQLDELSFNWKK